jgi:hypothetical protein
MADNLREHFTYKTIRVRIAAGTKITFMNLGNLIHNSIPYLGLEWNTGDLAKGESKAITSGLPVLAGC